VLNQLYGYGTHSVHFLSRQFSSSQKHYHSLGKELYAIVEAFRTWRPYLLLSEHVITVLKNHKNLEYFSPAQLNPKKKRLLKPKMGGWIAQLSDYNFKVVFKPVNNLESLMLSLSLVQKKSQKYQ
jgi:hypothetical protein